MCKTPEETYALGIELGAHLRPGDAVLLHGGLGAGKTLLTKGIMESVGFDPDEVTSPSFALVNLYNADAVDVYHIDLWRIDVGADAAFGVGLDEIVGEPNSIVIIEWAERLGEFRFPGRVWKVEIGGDGEDSRDIKISLNETHSEADAAG